MTLISDIKKRFFYYIAERHRREKLLRAKLAIFSARFSLEDQRRPKRNIEKHILELVEEFFSSVCRASPAAIWTSLRRSKWSANRGKRWQWSISESSDRILKIEKETKEEIETGSGEIETCFPVAKAGSISWRASTCTYIFWDS